MGWTVLLLVSLARGAEQCTATSTPYEVRVCADEAFHAGDTPRYLALTLPTAPSLDYARVHVCRRAAEGCTVVDSLAPRAPPAPGLAAEAVRLASARFQKQGEYDGYLPVGAYGTRRVWFVRPAPLAGTSPRDPCAPLARAASVRLAPSLVKALVDRAVEVDPALAPCRTDPGKLPPYVASRLGPPPAVADALATLAAAPAPSGFDSDTIVAALDAAGFPGAATLAAGGSLGEYVRARWVTTPPDAVETARRTLGDAWASLRAGDAAGALPIVAAARAQSPDYLPDADLLAAVAAHSRPDLQAFRTRYGALRTQVDSAVDAATLAGPAQPPVAGSARAAFAQLQAERSRLAEPWPDPPAAPDWAGLPTGLVRHVVAGQAAVIDPIEAERRAARPVLEPCRAWLARGEVCPDPVASRLARFDPDAALAVVHTASTGAAAAVLRAESDVLGRLVACADVVLARPGADLPPEGCPVVPVGPPPDRAGAFRALLATGSLRWFGEAEPAFRALEFDIQAGSDEEANLHALATLLRDHPGYVHADDVAAALVDSLRILGRTDEAAGAAALVAQAWPTTEAGARAFDTLGELAAAKGDFAAAWAAFAKEAAVTGAVEAGLRAALCEAMLGDAPGALDQLVTLDATATDVDRPRLRRWLAELYVRSGRTAEGRAWFRAHGANLDAARAVSP